MRIHCSSRKMPTYPIILREGRECRGSTGSCGPCGRPLVEVGVVRLVHHLRTAHSHAGIVVSSHGRSTWPFSHVTTKKLPPKQTTHTSGRTLHTVLVASPRRTARCPFLCKAQALRPRDRGPPPPHAIDHARGPITIAHRDPENQWLFMFQLQPRPSLHSTGRLAHFSPLAIHADVNSFFRFRLNLPFHLISTYNARHYHELCNSFVNIHPLLINTERKSVE